MQTSNILSIRDYTKAIPYPAAKHDKSVNHGFKNLKGGPTEAALIAEVQDNENLKNALIAINDEKTALFTVGCEKVFNKEGQRHWARGYIELSFNYPQLAMDATWYFKLFFDFSQYIFEKGFDSPIEFHWELDKAVFQDATPVCNGYSAAIWVTTAICETEQQTRNVWGEAVDFLTDYLTQIEANPALPAIYKT